MAWLLLLERQKQLTKHKEDAMKTAINTIIALLATTATAFAGNSAWVDNSGILCWAFMGLCALIVVGQLVPAIMVLIGAAKAIASNPEEAKTV